MKGKNPDRPPCGTCGKPSTCQVTIDVQDLELTKDREGSVYWAPGYRQGGTMIRARLCGDCLRSCVSVEVKAKAEVKEG